MFYMALVKYKDLPGIRNKFKDKKIVFCSGSFDLTHAGHVLFFEDCKKCGDVLVVGVGSDKLINKFKDDKRPVLNNHLRLKMVDSLKPVDLVFLNESKATEHPQTINEVAFRNLKPDVYVINKDASDIPYRKTMAKKYGVKMVILERRCPPEFGNISTTQLINKIKKS
jgi:cytidyltransferase-like protein